MTHVPHTFACWAPRDGGTCPSWCDCGCHITKCSINPEMVWWCDAHSQSIGNCEDNIKDTQVSDASIIGMVEGPKHLYKVIISGDVADMMFGNLFTDELFFKVNRESPIVVYSTMTDNDAVELAQRDGFQVTRARADWSI